jgi:hypothetical protein
MAHGNVLNELIWSTSGNTHRIISKELGECMLDCICSKRDDANEIR